MLVLFFVGWASTAQADIPASERLVLINLYESTGGASWTNNINWNGSAGTECTWYRVTCDATQSHVIQITLTNNHMVGSLPSISGLTALQYFSVNNNQLSGSVPSVGGLTALQFFDVGINQLTGSIPSLSGLTVLQYFDVQSNQLSGSLPSLNGLPSLRDFYVNDNQLSGSIPLFSGLPALRGLYLHNNQLSGAIPSLGGLPTLQLFFAFNNQLSGSIPSLGGLTLLGWFDVENNQLTGSIPSLGGTALQYFWVTNNHLTGPIPTAPASLIFGGSMLCGNSLVSSGDPSIDAAWVAAQDRLAAPGGNWLACQIPAEQTPPDRVDLPVDSSVAPSGQKAVVITHGWQSNVLGWPIEMANALCTKPSFGVLVSTTNPAVLDDRLAKWCQVSAPGNVLWDVWVLDWRKWAATGPAFPVIAWAAAKPVGEYLATQLKGKYEHIHLIAHSAGAHAIHVATRTLKDSGAAVHATYLDAFDPSALFHSTTNARHISKYGDTAKWVDSYVDTRSLLGFGLDTTDLYLTNGYNIDVTPTTDGCAGYDFLDALECRHGRPYRFFGRSLGPFSDLLRDPIGDTGTKGFPFSLEAGGNLNLLMNNKDGECRMQNDGGCLAVPPPSLVTWHYIESALAGRVVDAVTGAVSYVAGTGATLFNSIRLGEFSALSGSGVATGSALSATPTDSPSWIAVLPTTTQPVNTLRFNWRFAAAGEGFLRVYVNNLLVREIDQRHVSIASVTAEEIYIGGATGKLATGTHRIAIRLDGFGTSASGVELTGVDLGLTALNAPLDVDASFGATKYDAGTDGLLTLRYLFGLTGTSLTTGVLGGTASRTDPALIKARLDVLRTSLDIDGNGRADALTDGLLILRYMLGLRGASLITGAVDPLGTRKTAADIETYIQSLMP